MEEKKYRSGDFEYLLEELSPNALFGNSRVTSYVGPTGPGSVATIEPLEIDGLTYRVRNSHDDLLANQKIEKLVNNRDILLRLKDMPLLKEVSLTPEYMYEFSAENCPLLSLVTVDSLIDDPVSIKGADSSVTVIYRRGIKNEEAEVAPEGIHAIFGDEVEDIGVIRGGHVTLGKGVKEIKALKKAEFGLKADTSVGEYELPTRIDFATSEPPVVGSVAPGSMTVAELHVPAGALDAYMNHAQWGKAAYFIEEGGKTVDKYAAKHKARLKKLQKEREEAAATAAEEAKKEKVAAMGGVMHSTLATQRLAKWNHKLESEDNDKLNFLVSITPLEIELTVLKDAPIDIWDKIVAKLEEIETKLSK